MFSPLERKLLFSLALVLATFWLIFVWWSIKKQEQFFVEQMHREAQGIYQYITLTREWISSHGGIYIKQGKKIVLITPSHFTKDLADFASPRNLPFTFKVAVLHTQNPNHRPNVFEKKAIQKFQDPRVKEYWRYVKKEQKFLYAAPLRFQNVCYQCHSYMKDYKPPACISVTLSAKPFIKELRMSYQTLILASILITLLIFGVLFFFLRHFVLKPLHIFIKVSRNIEQGNLNGRVNINTGDEWEELSNCFNQMIDSLISHQEKLEEKIKEATRELHMAYEELKKIESFRSEFFSNITHDLKTPVTAIKGAIDLLDRKGQLDSRYLEIVRKNIEKLSKMIKDLLDCAKLESGQMELLLEENNIIAAINDAIFLVMPMAKEKDIELDFNPKKEKMNIVFDYEKIQQVITNLLTNAIKFTPPNTKIIIQVEEFPQEIRVSIEDFGPGIPEEEWPLVFKKFYQSSRTKRKGIGLGLAICKGIIEAHGGKIWVERPKHQGIIFYFSLPKKRGSVGE